MNIWTVFWICFFSAISISAIGDSIARSIEAKYSCDCKENEK